MIKFNPVNDIELAYRKLKSYAYQENYALDLKVLISEYEDDDINAKLKSLENDLNEYQKGNEDPIKKFIKQIEFRILPKKFLLDKNNPRVKFISNQNNLTRYNVERINYFIDCPIEIHLISVLWIMKIGQFIDKTLSKDCYGNRLIRDKDNSFSTNSFRLFNRYYIKYQEWRDLAIKKAHSMHKDKLDVAIVSLDIKSYYDSIDFDIDKIISHKSFVFQYGLDPDFLYLNNILSDIHKKYRIVRKVKNNLLPIGLLSSSIIANYYLKSFDDEIIKNIKPEYYGRYVDDILMVLSNPIVNKKSPELLLENIFEKSTIVNKIKDGFSITINKNYKHKLEFQYEKVKLYYFFAKEPITILKEFEKNIKLNSSEFRLLPEKANIFEDFDSNSFKINYSDTINKIRSVEGIDVDKFGASKQLTKLILTTKRLSHIESKDLSELLNNINNYFSGKRLLEHYGLWEKVFTFFVVNKQTKNITRFATRIIDSILKVKYSKDNLEINIKTSLLNKLIESMSMAFSLNISFLKEEIIKSIRKNIHTKNFTEQVYNDFTLENVQSTALKLVKTNMLRHQYTFYPLLNYCEQKDEFDFTSKSIRNVNFKISQDKLRFSPRFIHYYEICLFYTLKSLFVSEEKEVDYFDLFIKFNKLNKTKYEGEFPQKTLPKSKRQKYSEILIPKIKVKDKLKIAIANIKVDVNNSINSMLGKSNLNLNRLTDLNHILNLCLREKSELLILPEISIPFQWLDILSDFSKKNNIAIVCGIEHVKNKKQEVFNYSAVLLPFKNDEFNNLFIDLRLKIDYSPEEVKEISKYHFKVPKHILTEKLRLYDWNNLLFAVFNCYELCDIKKRAIFRGIVDFVVAIEFNKDTEHFSSIVESSSRDIHCYVIQVNNSLFGDSRITMPARSFKKDMMKIKGGHNTTIITGEINIKELRYFQIIDTNAQEVFLASKDYFKQTPPGFQISNKRHPLK